MNDIEKELINDLIAKRISLEEFLIKYPIDLEHDREYVISLLEHALEAKDSEDVEYGIWLFSLKEEVQGTLKERYVSVFCKLLGEPWHYQHENIVSLLQELKAPQSVDALYTAIFSHFKYLDYDDSFSLARKCIHALGDINTAYSREKLTLLTSSDIPIIREKAQKQLNYKR